MKGQGVDNLWHDCRTEYDRRVVIDGVTRKFCGGLNN